MQDLKARIEGLPAYPTEADLEEDEVMALRDCFSAALARLALMREIGPMLHRLVAAALSGDEDTANDYADRIRQVLAALEMPRG